MYEKILQLLRDAIELQSIILTPHAQEQMNEDDLLTFDLEHCVLAGTIVERQWDDSFKEWKYLIEGVKPDENKQIVFITTYRIYEY